MKIYFQCLIILFFATSCFRDTQEKAFKEIELITKQTLINSHSTCWEASNSRDVVLLKITNHHFDTIFIPLSDSRKEMWYNPETIGYFSESLNGDTLYGLSRATICSFSDRLDTLFSGQIKYYCLGVHHFTIPSEKFDYAQFKFPYFTRGNDTPKHFQLLTTLDQNPTRIKQMTNPIPDHVPKHAMVTIDKNKHVILE